ncbi:MAG TPA: enoyl-CoA hydratase-related protein, partial [Stellaceae bacterium]|nr:enoyl-CoA hydratase-related protein [Stellaceae bacterium]
DRVVGTLERCRKPTIAAIAGACTGGGGALAAACDLRIAAANARFGFPVARTLGNCLSAGNYARLASLVGVGRAKAMIFTARLVEAEEAKSVGLVSEVLPDHAALMARAEALAKHVASLAPLTLRATKEALHRLMPRIPTEDGRDIILMCYMSKDFQEGMDAFLNKRTPQWKGE